MAEQTPLYMDISSAYSGDELGLPYRDLISEGIVAATDLAVTATGPASLSVDVAKGACWVLGDTNADRQPCYRCFNDAVVNKGITPDPSNPRKVLVVAQITDEGFSGTGRKWEIVAIHGTPAAAPVEPALPASAIPLALIDVTAADTSIDAAQITDRRTRATLFGQLAVPRSRVRKSVAQSIPDNAYTALTWDVEDTDTDRLFVSTANTRLTCRTPGAYRITGVAAFLANATGVRGARIYKNGVADTYTQTPAPPGTANAALPVTDVLDLVAGDYLELYCFQNSGGALNASTDCRFMIERIGS